MYRKRSALIVMASLWAFSMGAAEADTLVTWPFQSGSSKSGTAGVDHLTSINLTRGPGIIENSGGTFNSKDWEEGSNLTQAIANDNYVQFGFTLDAAYETTVSQFTSELDRSGTGPKQVSLLVSQDNFSTYTDLGAKTVSDAGSAQTWNFSYTGAGTVLFRVYGYNASSAAGTFDFESNLILSGSQPELVPEPASMVLVALGVVAVAGRRPRRGA